MTRLCPGKFWRVALGVLFLPPACWVALLAALPTGCARRAVVDRLAQASGRAVTLERVRLGVCGGVYLQGLTIGAPGGGDDPWLRVDEAAVDVGLLPILLGRVEPTDLDVRGVTLRILRRQDGGLELADLLRPSAPAEAGSRAAQGHEPAAVRVRVRDASVLIVDEPTGTRLDLREVEGQGVWQGTVAHLNELKGSVHGGTFQIAAQLDRSGAVPAFEGQIRLRDVALRPASAVLTYLVPVLAGATGGANGRVALDLFLRGQGATRAEVVRTLAGQGRVSLDPVVLDGSAILDGLGGLGDLPAKGRVGAVNTSLKVSDGRVMSDDLTLDLGRTPLVFSGWTDLEGRVDYRLVTEGLAGRLPARARAFLADLSIGLDELADVRLGGTLDALTVTVQGVKVGARGVPDNALDDRQRLREIGRRLRDRVRR